MSLISLRATLRSSRRRLAIVLILVGIGGAVTVHHAMPMNIHAMPGHAICMAVLAGTLLLAVATAVNRASARLPRPTNHVLPAARPEAWCRSVPARAGPLCLRLSVLRL